MLVTVGALYGLYSFCSRQPPEPKLEVQESPQRPVVPPEPAPCAAATANDLLANASRLVEERANKAADASPASAAARIAEQAVRLSPRCAEAWSTLALARYRVAYDVCGKGTYGGAVEAAQKALQVDPDTAVKAAALRTLGRIADARLNWREAVNRFTESQQFEPTDSDAKSWLAQLNVVQNLRPSLLTILSRVFDGEELDEADLQQLTEGESSYVTNAVLARTGRRMNVGHLDWLFFCSNSPVANRPAIDLDAVRREPAQGTRDFVNFKLAVKRQRQN